MVYWLIAKTVFGVIVVTSFTSVGLLALWAATSARHWLLRTAVVLVAISPLLLIPAYEPWIVFALQACVIAAGVQTWRPWTTRRRAKDAPPENTVQPDGRFRFSLRTLLAIVPLVAVLTVILTRIVVGLPELNLEAWTTIVLNGICSGCAVLLGAWLFASRRKWIACPTALVLCLGLSAVMAWFDWFFWSAAYFQGWPPTSQALLAPLGLTSEAHPVWAWFAMVPVVVGVTWLMVFVRFAGWGGRGDGEIGNARPRTNRRPVLARCIFGLALLILVAPPAFITWKLLHLEPLPNVSLPDPNGLDDIVAAGKVFEKSAILNADSGANPEEVLAAEIAKYAEAYARLRLGLSRECQVSAWPQDDDLDAALDLSMDNFILTRSAARALMHEGELARHQSRYGDAARSALDNVRMSHASIRGGLLVDYLVGLAVEGIGNESLYRVLQHLSADQCREAIDALAELERSREPLDDVLHRDRIWEEHAYGWFGRFCLVVNDIATPDAAARGTERLLHKRAIATTGLLKLELALRACQLERGALPDRLEQLVPDILSELPLDPFDPQGSPLRYIRSDDEAIVYSVGPDRKDDQGYRPPDPTWASGYDRDGEGDWQLVTLFPADEEEPSE
jgi:hypothetical protein